MWYLVLNRHTVSLEERTSHLADHATWVIQQQEAGNLLFSGPSPDRSVSIHVYRAGSEEEVRGWIDTDPFHQRGFFTSEIIPWEAHQVLGSGAFGEGAARMEARARLGKG